MLRYLLTKFKIILSDRVLPDLVGGGKICFVKNQNLQNLIIVERQFLSSRIWDFGKNLLENNKIDFRQRNLGFCFNNISNWFLNYFERQKKSNLWWWWDLSCQKWNFPTFHHVAQKSKITKSERFSFSFNGFKNSFSKKQLFREKLFFLL